MNLNDYQARALNIAVFGSDIDWIYPFLKLCGEVSEVLEKIEEIYVSQGGRRSEIDNLEIAKELGDCLWYVTYIGRKLGLSLEEISKSAERLNLVRNQLEISCLRLAISSGQMSETMGKVFRDKKGNPDAVDLQSLRGKSIEVFYWIQIISKDYGFTIADIARINIEKLEDRSRRNVLNGEGDNR